MNKYFIITQPVIDFISEQNNFDEKSITEFCQLLVKNINGKIETFVWSIERYKAYDIPYNDQIKDIAAIIYGVSETNSPINPNWDVIDELFKQYTNQTFWEYWQQ
jgi:hypothetical protein